MSDSQLTSIVLLILGSIFIYEKTFIGLVKIGNEIRGSKTKITKNTLLFGKVVGILALISGIGGILTFGLK